MNNASSINEELMRQIVEFRTACTKSDTERDAGLTTPDDIKRFDNLSYGPYGEENLLDIYMQKSAPGLQPAIINIHGGGWVYGSKEVYQYYCMGLAQRGFTVVNINYRLAPESKFPAAVEDINAALSFVAENGAAYNIDKDRLVLVGDSAGGQLVSHYATIATNPDFAKLFSFKVPDITIRAVALNCSAYFERKDLEAGENGLFGAYADVEAVGGKEKLVDMLDTLGNMTSDFPPAFVMSAVNDFLRDKVQPMYDIITGLGVPCEMKIYGSADRPDIAHVFHVNCRLEEAKRCNDDECDFFKKYVK